MKKINKSFLVIALLLGALFGNCKCKKDPDPTPEPKPTVPLEDLTAYSYFKTGTYWIYKDSATGIEDSVYVYFDTSYSYYQNNGIQAAGNYMYHDCKIHSNSDTYNYYYKISGGNYSISTGENGVERIRTKPGNYIGETYLMSNRFIEGDQIGLFTGTGTTYFKMEYSSFLLEGNIYNKVVKFYDDKNASEYESPTNFYIAKNIGIIRKEILDSMKIWNLIRYNIIN